MGNFGKNSNFNSPFTLSGTDLEVTGSSEVPEGAKLVSRHVIIKQGTSTIEGPANHALDWAADPVLAAGGIVAGPAVAIATETHVVQDRAFFVTATWSTIVEIKSVP